MSIIKTKHLSYHYIRHDEEGNVEGEVPAVKDVNLSVEPGEMRRMKKICAGSIHIWSDCLRMADMSSLDKDKKSEKVLSCQKTCDKIERNGQKKETKLCNCSRNRRKHGSFV